MKKFSVIQLFFALLIAVFTAAPAHAVIDVNETYSIGFLVGPALEGNNFGNNLGYEAKLGARLFPGLSTSLYYWRFTSGATVTSADSNTTINSSNALSAFGFEVLYNVQGTFWWLGGKFADMRASGTASGNDTIDGNSLNATNSNSCLGWAPTAIFEIPMGNFAVGAEAAYFVSLSGSVPRALSTLAMIRLRF